MTGSRTPTLEPPRRAPEIPLGPIHLPPPGGNGGQEASSRPPASAASIVVWLLVGAITVLFASFTSTYLARRGEADWQVGPLPAVLWVSTALLVVSSLVLEWTRRRARAGRTDHAWTGLLLTLGLGLGFLGAQWTAWRQLNAMGVYLATTPHSAFFFLLTGMHALHLASSLMALSYALWRTRGALPAAGASGILDPVAVYWHFLDGLWLYLFVMLFAV